jgi:hypothetical protein
LLLLQETTQTNRQAKMKNLAKLFPSKIGWLGLRIHAFQADNGCAENKLYVLPFEPFEGMYSSSRRFEVANCRIVCFFFVPSFLYICLSSHSLSERDLSK